MDDSKTTRDAMKAPSPTARPSASATPSATPSPTANPTLGPELGETALDMTPALEAAWAKVEAEWDDASAHDKLIALCASVGRLDFAGGRFRLVRERDPARAERAQRSIDRIVALAMQTLELHREPPPPDPKRVLFPVALLLVTALVGTALWVWLDAAR